MMPRGTRRHVALTMLAVGGLFFVSCSHARRTIKDGPPVGSKNHDKALLYIDKNILGTKRIYAYPDPFVISKYGGGETSRDITWSYIHDKTTITFEKDKDIGPVKCDDAAGTCSLKLTGDLLKGYGDTRQLKYTINGAENEKTLPGNDPWVEIDR